MKRVLEVAEVNRVSVKVFFKITHQDFTILPRRGYSNVFTVNEKRVYIESCCCPEFDNMCHIFLCGDEAENDHYTLEVPLRCLEFFLDTIEAVNRHYGYDMKVCGV